MKKTIKTLLFTISLVGLTGLANATPVQWSSNGHWYDFIASSDLLWTEAKLEAESMNGYLATLTSAAEQDWVFNQFFTTASLEIPWIGASKNSLGEWEWVTGEVWDWTNWGTGEPNNVGNDEDYLEIIPTNGGAWNDRHDWYTRPYLIEYEGSPVPIPGAVWLLGTGLIGLLGFRRKASA